MRGTPVGTLLRLSGGADLPAARPSRDDARRALADLGVRYVVVNRTTSRPALLEYVREVLPLDPIVTEGERTLFAMR